MDELALLKWIGVCVASLFLVFTSYAYQRFRKPLRLAEMKRVLKRLSIPDDDVELYLEKRGHNLALAVTFLSLVTFVGLTLLTTRMEFPQVVFGEASFPQEGSRLLFGMAFLGAYLWGIQHIFRRYTVNDLSPSIYYRLSTRMILAPVIAMTVFNAYGALVGVQTNPAADNQNVWTLIALFVGMFPQRALHWVADRLPVFSPETDPSVRKLPLQMIQGIEIHDRMRLEEEGVHTCYDLANHDFIPLFLKTPYSARQLVDWILQARLCEYVADAVKGLREHGILKITDLAGLEEDDLKILAHETTVTVAALKQAQKWVEKHKDDLERLRTAARRASKYLALDKENVELVKGAYAAFKEGNIPDLLDTYAENATLIYPVIDGVAYSGPRRGRGPIEEFFESVTAAEDIQEFIQKDYIAQDDRVVVTGRSKALVKATGRTLDLEYVHLFTVSGGKIQRFVQYFDTVATADAYRQSTGAGA